MNLNGLFLNDNIKLIINLKKMFSRTFLGKKVNFGAFKLSKSMSFILTSWKFSHCKILIEIYSTLISKSFGDVLGFFCKKIEIFEKKCSTIGFFSKSNFFGQKLSFRPNFDLSYESEFFIFVTIFGAKETSDAAFYVSVTHVSISPTP